MATTAKQRFDDVMDRCDSLVAQSQGSSVCDDILRAAVVLAVSALDMYAADRFAEEFVPELKRKTPSKEDVDFFTEIGVGIKEVLGVLKETPKKPYKRLRKLLDDYLSRNSMQSFSQIERLYKYYGLPKIIDNACEKSGAKTLKNRVGKMLERRNEIVHNCDYDGKNALQPILRKDVEYWIRSLKKLVDNMEQIIHNRFQIVKGETK
ncbi:MAG: hypothetical protein IJR99_05900 [Kiritimatiellae bacterium]|nr:hypothetical protein [Kiritimatiellia bacterium]